MLEPIGRKLTIPRKTVEIGMWRGAQKVSMRKLEAERESDLKRKQNVDKLTMGEGQ